MYSWLSSTRFRARIASDYTTRLDHEDDDFRVWAQENAKRCPRCRVLLIRYEGSVGSVFYLCDCILFDAIPIYQAINLWLILHFQAAVQWRARVAQGSATTAYTRLVVAYSITIFSFHRSC
jgi:hypothetical protein